MFLHSLCIEPSFRVGASWSQMTVTFLYSLQMLIVLSNLILTQLL